MQSLKIKTTLRILTTAFAVIPMLIVGIVGYFSMTGFAANSVSQFARAAGAAQQEIINQYINECISDVAYLSLSRLQERLQRAVRAMMPSQCFRSLPRISPTETAVSRTL